MSHVVGRAGTRMDGAASGAILEPPEQDRNKSKTVVHTCQADINKSKK